MHCSLADINVAPGINRNIVECKSDSSLFTSLKTFELIETLWNVNELSLLVAVLGFTELIETLWNVNLISCVFLSSHKTN